MEAFGVIGMSFGMMGFIFSMSAMSQIASLRKELEDAGVLDKESKSK